MRLTTVGVNKRCNHIHWMYCKSKWNGSVLNIQWNENCARHICTQILPLFILYSLTFLSTFSIELFGIFIYIKKLYVCIGNSSHFLLLPLFVCVSIKLLRHNAWQNVNNSASFMNFKFLTFDFCAWKIHF